MGFTLAAALSDLGPRAEVIVSELVPEVVRWNRGPLGDLANHPLRDPRVSVREIDVAAIIRAEPCAYDAILLDVDNGPEGITRTDNDWLYGRAGLSTAAKALRPGGVLAIWSASPDRAFARRLGATGFLVEEVELRARGYTRGARHTIWVARSDA
jgi:spermidine synthase